MRRNRHTDRRLSWALAAVLLGSGAMGGVAWASGFALREGSADWTANAFAGGTAKAYDAGTAWSNPAGMVLLGHNELDASVSYIDPYTRFNGLDVSSARMVSGGGGNNADPGVAPGGFGVWSVNPDLAFGFAVTAPFGSTVDYPGDSGARFQTLVSRITDIQLQLVAAYRITDRLSIGGGPVIDSFSSRLSQVVDLGPLNRLAGDPVSNFEGDDVGIGFDLGSLYQLTENLRVGVNYHSRIDHDVVGNQGVFIPPMLSVLSPGTAAQLNVVDGRSRTQITLPDNVALGAYWQVTKRLALMAELQWTDWSLFNNLTLSPINGQGPGKSIAENWRDTWFASIGASYQLLEALTIQTGLGYDQSPVPGSATRYAGIPDTDRIILGVGFTYMLFPNVDLQFGYGHSFGLPARINSVQAGAANRLVGSIADHGDSFSVGVRAKF